MVQSQDSTQDDLAGVENLFGKNMKAFDKLINQSDASKQLSDVKKNARREVASINKPQPAKPVEEQPKSKIEEVKKEVKVKDEQVEDGPAEKDDK